MYKWGNAKPNHYSYSDYDSHSHANAGLHCYSYCHRDFHGDADAEPHGHRYCDRNAHDDADHHTCAVAFVDAPGVEEQEEVKLRRWQGGFYPG